MCGSRGEVEYCQVRDARSSPLICDASRKLRAYIRDVRVAAKFTAPSLRVTAALALTFDLQ
jgi:hypothetical protein